MGHHPRSSAAFLHGQALSCFSRVECSVARVLKITRGRVKHRSFKDITADPFHGSCVHRHGALNRFFSLLEVHVCGSPAVEACFDARFSENVFCELCIGVSFFSLLCVVDACSTVFSFCAVDACSIFFFMHGTPAAYAEQGERSAALPLEKGRELELRVMHSRDMELMASVVRK